MYVPDPIHCVHGCLGLTFRTPHSQLLDTGSSRSDLWKLNALLDLVHISTITIVAANFTHALLHRYVCLYCNCLQLLRDASCHVELGLLTEGAYFIGQGRNAAAMCEGVHDEPEPGNGEGLRHGCDPDDGLE
jgi:hypothetical protein